MRTPSILLLLALFPAAAGAQWVWSPETGWVNTRYVGSASAKQLAARAKALEQAKQHQDASAAYSELARKFPSSQQAAEALFLAAENKFQAGEIYDANALYEEYLERHRKDERTPAIAKRRFECARALLRGEKKRVLGLKLFGAKEKGEQILRSIVDDYPFEKDVDPPPDDVTDDAMFVLGNYYYEEARYSDAEEIYRKLREKFPRSEWAPVSLFKVGMCHKQQNLGAAYDTSSLGPARASLAEYRKSSPEGTEFREAGKQLSAIEETLAAKDLEIGRFYWKKDQRRAAAIYFRRVVARHPKTGAAAEAKGYLAQMEQPK